MELLVPTSAGELIDKITILALKAEKIADPERLANVRHEAARLEEVEAGLPAHPELAAMKAELAEINARLWQIEDDIRAREAAGDFGADFIALARAVYRTNDLRAAVKKRINLALGSAIVEEKSYTDPGPA
ncbi:DUF6165 family protein [Pseudoroseicyclus tamaricis]|uniref:Uncharacterized protein n=1 Tax=Pseudoroseicyclus tamaricis TaxID=2705421 RepID=A0A6B2JW59_9RHOB|nr:DUF6165 family protein [Pseudoroseicyclus tamaricis]NDV02518.1 hypothetical protein [Pseudoroseicyclus tamaricis]